MADTTIVQADNGNLQVRLLDNLRAGAGDGFTITVEDDAVFTSLPSVNGLIVTGKNATGTPNIIRRSGTGTNPPVFVNMTTSQSDASWTHLGGGVWSFTTSALVGNMWAGYDNGFWGVTNMMKNVLFTPSAEFEYWAVSSTQVRVYTGSAVVAPPTYYSGLAMALDRQCAFGVTNSSNIEFTGIASAGARVAMAVGHQQAAGIGSATQNLTNLLFTDCRAYMSWVIGLGVGVSTSTFNANDIEFVRFFSDGKTTNSSKHNVLDSQHGNAEGIRVQDSYDNIVFTDYISNNWGHIQILVEQDSARVPGLVTFRAGANYGNLEMLETNQAHGFSVLGPENSTQHATLGVARLSGMKVRGQAAQSTLGGRCVASGFTMKDFIQPGIASENFLATAISSLFNSVGNIRAYDVTVEGGYIENPFSFPFSLYDETGSIATDAIKLRHNTIVDQTYRSNSTYRSPFYPSGAINASIIMWPGSGSVNDQIIEYNNFIVSGGNGQNLVYFNSSSTVNGHAGVTANNIENIDGMVNRAQGDYRVTTLGGLYQAGTTANANSKDLVNAAFHSPASITPHQELSDPQDPPGQIAPPKRYTAIGVRSRSRGRRAL